MSYARRHRDAGTDKHDEEPWRTRGWVPDEPAFAPVPPGGTEPAIVKWFARRCSGHQWRRTGGPWSSCSGGRVAARGSTCSIGKSTVCPAHYHLDTVLRIVERTEERTRARRGPKPMQAEARFLPQIIVADDSTVD
jgi:hypothetical protein